MSSEVVSRVGTECRGILHTGICPEEFDDCLKTLKRTSPEFSEFLLGKYKSLYDDLYGKLPEHAMLFPRWCQAAFWTIFGPVYYWTRGQLPQIEVSKVEFLFDHRDFDAVLKNLMRILAFDGEGCFEWKNLFTQVFRSSYQPPLEASHLAACVALEAVEGTKMLLITPIAPDDEALRAGIRDFEGVRKTAMVSFPWLAELMRVSPWTASILNADTEALKKITGKDGVCEFATEEQAFLLRQEILARTAILFSPVYRASGGMLPAVSKVTFVRWYLVGEEDPKKLKEHFRGMLQAYSKKWAVLYTYATVGYEEGSFAERVVAALGLALLDALPELTVETALEALQEKRFRDAENGRIYPGKRLRIFSGGVPETASPMESAEKIRRDKRFLRRVLSGVSPGAPGNVICRDADSKTFSRLVIKKFS